MRVTNQSGSRSQERGTRPDEQLFPDRAGEITSWPDKRSDLPDNQQSKQVNEKAGQVGCGEGALWIRLPQAAKRRRPLNSKYFGSTESARSGCCLANERRSGKQERPATTTPPINCATSFASNSLRDVAAVRRDGNDGSDSQGWKVRSHRRGRIPMTPDISQNGTQ